MAIQRVAGFIDGYNLYHGISEGDDGKHRCWLWVDLFDLIRRIAPKENTEVVAVNFYTAEARTPVSRSSQDAFVSANAELHPEFRAVWGFMKPTSRDCGCPACLAKPTLHVEKRSDVNLAVDMVRGACAHDPEYDLAVLVTGDADQVASVEAAQAAGRTVIVAYPPDRRGDHLGDACHKDMIKISSTMLRRSQMNNVVVSQGRVHSRPDHWPDRPGQFPENE